MPAGLAFLEEILFLHFFNILSTKYLIFYAKLCVAN
jgi:hypothetical protein